MPEQLHTIEGRLAGLREFVDFPPTPEFVVPSSSQRVLPRAAGWSSVRRLALAATALAALGVATVSAANAGAISDRVGEALGLRAQSNVYYTVAFEPAFSITFPDLVSVDVALDKRDAFQPGHSSTTYGGARVVDGQFLFGVYRPVGWEPVERSARVIDPQGATIRGATHYMVPSDMVVWLQAHPCLETREPESRVNIGEVDATQVEVSWECGDMASLENPEVPLFYVEDPAALVGDSFVPRCCGGDLVPLLPVNIVPHVRYSFWFAEVEGEDIVIFTPAPGEDTFSDDFERIVRPMLESIRFE